MRRTILLSFAALLLACDEQRLPDQPARIAVCATTFALADVARQVGSDGVHVDWLLDLGDPIENVVLTPAEKMRMGTVDFTFTDGDRGEPWLRHNVGGSVAIERGLTLDSLPVAITTPQVGLLALDPIVVREAATALVERWSIREPRRREQFARQSKAFVTALDNLVAEYPNRSMGRGQLLVTTPLLNPLLDRFGVRSILVECDVLALSDATIETLAETARREHLRAMLLPFDTPPGAVTDLEQRTKVKVFHFDPVGSANYPAHGDYLSIVRFNLGQLRAATQY